MIFPGDVEAQERWMVHKGHEETYQQAHRLRLIRTPGKTLIIADREWPTYLLGEADVTISIPSTKTKKGRAVSRILEWLETHEELFKEDCWKLGIGWEEDECKIRKAYDGDDGLILFAGNDWWTDLSRAVLEAMPDLEILGIKNNHGKASKALRRKQ